MANGVNRELFPNKRRLSANDGSAKAYMGPGDVESAAREYNMAVVYTDITALDDDAQVVRHIDDSWNGETWVSLFNDTLSTIAPVRKAVNDFGGYLRVWYEVKKGTAGSQVGASFGSGITYKQG